MIEIFLQLLSVISIQIKEKINLMRPFIMECTDKEFTIIDNFYLPFIFAMQLTNFFLPLAPNIKTIS